MRLPVDRVGESGCGPCPPPPPPHSLLSIGGKELIAEVHVHNHSTAGFEGSSLLCCTLYVVWHILIKICLYALFVRLH